MSFSSFGNPSATAAQVGGPQNGPDLEDIRTEALGFLALAGESKVQLLSSPWPSEQLPPSTSSLMSIASHKGLLAAAGPDGVVVASTESVRKAFDGLSSGDSHLKPFQPELKIPMSMRISQLAFSADETYLVLSAENGGGLAVYEVAALSHGSTQSAFELSTSGQSLRALVPNPTPEKGELFAVVTFDDNLIMANLKDRNFVAGPNGQVLKNGVSSVSWSTRGKQLVAGLRDGTAHQMTPEGEGKGDIPKPPNMEIGSQVSSITWLENNVFLMVHTPSSYSNDNAPFSTFHVVTRNPNLNSFMFQKISDPAGPFGLNRSPPHHSMLRLKDFPPNLQDMVIVTSSASADIGLFTRSKVPLTGDKPAAKISEVFTMTEMSDDSRRAQLPITADLGETSPIGIALDLSSKEKVQQPIPGDEIDDTPTPLPALMVLNNEGVLAAWWVVYTESIRQGTIYTGLVVAPLAHPRQISPAPVQTQSPAFGASLKPTFGSSTFGSQNATPAFASTYTTTSFGAPSLLGPAAGAFGAPSGLGQQKSVWGTPSTSSLAPITGPAFGSSAFESAPAAQSPTPAFAAPAFGSTTTPSFSNSGLPGNRPSVWGAAGSKAPAFGQTGGLGKPNSVFGTPSPTSGTAPSSSGGFASFAAGKGFANAAATSSTSRSIFGAKTTTNTFGTPTSTSPMDTNSTIGGLNKMDNLPAKPFGSNVFVLDSTFKADPSAGEDGPPPSNESKSSFFGGGFGNALVEAAKTPVVETPVSKETDMDSTDETMKPEKPSKAVSTTPVSTPAPAKSMFFNTSTPTGGGLFGTPPTTSTPASKAAAAAGFSFGQSVTDEPESAGFSFGDLTNPAPSLAPKTQAPPDAQPSTESAETAGSPKVKDEPEPGTPAVSYKIPEAPLPPSTTSKDSYAAGDTSNSSVETDAPLPPDFIIKAAPMAAQVPPAPSQVSEKPVDNLIIPDMIPPSNVPGGPEDEGGDSDFLTEDDDDDEGEDEDEGGGQSEEPSDEGSGEDVAKDLSPISEPNQTPAITPQSSFGGLNSRTPDTNLFTKIQIPVPANRRAFFGEINRSVPVLPPPKLHASPRSPSPVRSVLPGRMLQPDASRSVSAPGVASQILGSQKLPVKSTGPSQTAFALSIEEERAREQRRAEIKAQKEAEEKRALVDDEDEMMQRHLASEVEATTTLDEFVAHSDYISKSSKESIPHQVEVVYRDINSMIDTLGFNARSLKAFVKGHNEQYKEQGRTREDLYNDEDWCLVEIEDLSSIVEKELTRQLESGRITDVANKLEICNELQKDIIRLRAKHEDIKKIIDSQQDSDQQAIARSQPLSAEQAAQQHDLRRDFMKFQKLLSETEERLTTIKAKIVSQATSSGRSNGSAGPTVEAVMRTISKMTSMAEKRSGDIDVLEGQMRKLRFSSTISTGSREGSPFATPQNNRASTRHSGTSNTYGLFYTPDSIKDSRRDLRSSLMSSTNSHAISSPPRKKVSGYSADEKAQLKAKMGRRKEVTDRLKFALQKAGTNVRLMDDE